MSLKESLLSQLNHGPRTAKQLRGATGADAKKIKKALDALVKEGTIRVDKGVYALRGAQQSLVPARLVKLARNFGFAAAEDGSGDIFIPGHSLLGALPGDQVLVTLSAYPRRPGSREGEIQKVISSPEKIIGTVEFLDGRLVLLPDNAPETPLAIRRGTDGGAKPGDKAAGELLVRGKNHVEHQVGITMCFGSAESSLECVRAMQYGAGLDKNFPAGVKAEAKRIGAFKIIKEDFNTRSDLRGEAIFTIDSASTKDIDDAIGVKRRPDGFILGVHIADVSHYVRPKTSLDEEAYNRGTSVYFGENVIPMLPKQISNGICSLNPGEDRLAFSCLLTLDNDGSLLDYHFCKTVIRSRVKGVYDEVNALFAGTAAPEVAQKYADVADGLPVLQELYRKLVALRAVRGSMEIESEEPKLVFDAAGRCVDVEKRTRGDAERMIEEFMLLANTAAAHLARRMGIPFVYRVHDKPTAEKVELLKNLLKATGVDFSFKGDVPTQTELSALLDKTRGTNLERPVHNGVLRSMAKAAYEPQPKGHFGLALQDYAHFTSPIRRYPDLAIHRILSDVAAGAKTAALGKRYAAFAEAASVQSSERELVAQKFERACDDCYKAEYMKQFLGEEFDGVVSSVVPFGLYVELPNTVEGLVHVSQLSSGPMDLVQGVCLTDPVTGRSYRIGDALRVKVAAANVSQGKIDFVPAAR